VWAQIVSAPAQYLLTTTVNPPGAGTITPSGWYDGGLSVPVSATPNGSYVFTGFSGGLTGATSPQNVTMNGPVSVTANFVNPTGLRAVSSTPYFLPFSVDGTPCATGSCLFSAQSGGDTLTVTQTAPLSTGRVPAYQYSAPDGSVAPQVISAPPPPTDGGSGCPWTCRNGSCSAPITVEPPQPAPIIYSVTNDAAGTIPAVLYPGVPTTIYIKGTNFGSVQGYAQFCTPGGSPCNFSEIIEYSEAIVSWTNNLVEETVTMDPQTPVGLWLVYMVPSFWITGSDAGHPSMGDVEMEPTPTLQILETDTTTDTTTEVSDSIRSVVVGHWVDLTAAVVNPGPYTYSFAWSQPQGKTVTYWDDHAFPSSPPTPISASDLESAQIGFAWSDTSGRGQQLRVTATPSGGGPPLTATVMYNISLPPLTLEPVQEQGAVVAPNCPGVSVGTTAMCLFGPTTGAQGIVIAVDGFSAPFGIEWLQVINGSTITSTNSSGASCTDSVSGLDGGKALPFCPATPDSLGTCDSPGVALPQHPGDQEQTMAMNMSTFLMFKPNNFSDDDIWVPIWRVDWGWSGDAQLFATWSITGSDPPAGGTVVPPEQTSGYPSWGAAPALPPPPCAEQPGQASLVIASPVMSGANATITVTLNGPAPVGGAAVSLTGSGPAFSAPASCTVPAGAIAQTCPGTAGTVTSSQQVAISAAYGNLSLSATVTVLPNQ
jgi:hypothetical protein